MLVNIQSFSTSALHIRPLSLSCFFGSKDFLFGVSFVLVLISLEFQTIAQIDCVSLRFSLS